MDAMPLQKIAIEIDDGRLATVAPLERMSRGEINITPIVAHQEDAVVRVYRESARGHDVLTTFRLTHLTRFGRSRPVMRLSTVIGRRGNLVITVSVDSVQIARQTVEVSKYVGAGPSRAYTGVIALAVIALVIVGAVHLVFRSPRLADRSADRRPEVTRSEAASVAAQPSLPPAREREREPARATAHPEPAQADPGPLETTGRDTVQPVAPRVSDERRGEPASTEPVSTVYFAPDSAQLSDAAVRELEAELAGIIAAVAAGLRVAVEGHCAPAGSREFLLALSRERAEAVANFLVDSGLPAPDLIVGYGADRVITSDSDRLHLNRRVEIVLASPNTR